MLIIPRQGRLGEIGAVLEQHELVRMGFGFGGRGVLSLSVEGVNDARIYEKLRLSGIQFVDRDGVRLVVLGPEPECVGLDAEIRVFRHEDHRKIVMLQVQGRGQDAVIGLGRDELGRQALRRLVVELHAQGPAPVELHALGELPFLPVLVQDPRDLARVSADFVDPFLELVQFLDHHDGDGHIVVLEGKDRPRIMEQHIGVQNK